MAIENLQKTMAINILHNCLIQKTLKAKDIRENTQFSTQ